MHLCNVVVIDWKPNIKTVVGILNLLIVFMLPMPVIALQTALVRPSDGSVYQIRFRNINPNSGYSISDFVDNFSIYDETGTIELCRGNNESVTWELYTAARVLAKTPRNTSLFDTSALTETVIQTGEVLGIDQDGNVKFLEIFGKILKEMVVDDIQRILEGILEALDPLSLDLGVVSINLRNLRYEVEKIKIRGEPIVLATSTDVLARLIDVEIEMRRVFYTFSQASEYANAAIHLQVGANQKAAQLWDIINAGEVVDIVWNPFRVDGESVKISDEVGVLDPLLLRLVAEVYQDYAEHAVKLGADLGKQAGHPAIPENPTNIGMISSLLFAAASAANVLEEKTALDQLDDQLANHIGNKLHANISDIYDSAEHDLTSHGFCSPDIERKDHEVPEQVSVPIVGDSRVGDSSPRFEDNQAPEVNNQINPQNFRIGDSPKWRNLSSYFRDPDDDKLTYTATSSDDSVATANISDNSIEITPGQPGTAIVTITTRDTGGLTVTQSFAVTVREKLETIPSLPVCSRTPQVRDEIMERARVRDCARVTEDHLEAIKRLSMLEKGITTLKQGDFDELRNLEELILKGNFLSVLPEEVFWYLGELKELSLRNNQFTILVEDTFEHLDSLTCLNLRGNQLTTLERGAFDDLETLIELDLSDNQLTTLPAGVFEDLPNLEELTLENNRIAILSRGGFLGLSSVEDLEFEGNPLHTIEAGAFNGLSSLTDLEFHNYPIHTIEAGAFNGLSSLTDLELGNTQLSMLPRDVFSGLSSLEDLDLYRNPLRTIEAGTFNGLSSLINLDLNNTQLSMLPRDVFSGLSSLEDLDLEENYLQAIEVGAFNGLSNLNSLDLGDNQLTTLSVDVFSGLNKLTQLKLDENQFATLPADIFGELSTLEHLNLSENQLHTLPAGVFKNLSNLRYLNLQDNPGAPFSLTLELVRADSTNLKTAGPATIKVKLAEGAPFDISIGLSIRGGTLSTNTVTLTIGQTESDPIRVIQKDTNFATVHLGAAPTVPRDYSGIQIEIGAPLVLFSDQSISPGVLIPDENLRTKVRDALGLEADATITQQKMKILKSLQDVRGITNLTGLEHAINLTNLTIVGSRSITDYTPLASLTNLSDLLLASNNMSDVTPLTSLTNLTRLNLDNNQISDLTPLANLTKLRKLELGSNNISDLTPLANLTNLTVLVLERNQIRDLMPIANLPNLTRLHMTAFGHNDLTPLANLTNLTHLYLQHNQIGDLTPLANLTNLTELQLGSNSITDVAPLANLTKLTSELDLGSNNISDVTPLANLTNLTELNLDYNNISDVTPLTNLTKIWRLMLSSNNISDVTALANLTKIEWVNLRDNQIVDVSPLENLTALDDLYLRGNPITDLAPLRRLKQENPNVNIDIDINADVDNVQAAPSAPMLPTETTLFPNYPNPFNPETWIPYQLAKAANVTLTIYDVRGIVVRQLVLGHQSAGFYQNRTHAAHWDGRNALGEKVASGLYFFIFTAGDFTATRRMLILK